LEADSLTREELIEVIRRKHQTIAAQDITISQLAIKIAEQAGIIAAMSTTENAAETDQYRKRPAR
jgi:hypothetical protein